MGNVRLVIFGKRVLQTEGDGIRRNSDRYTADGRIGNRPLYMSSAHKPEIAVVEDFSDEGDIVEINVVGPPGAADALKKYAAADKGSRTLHVVGVSAGEASV